MKLKKIMECNNNAEKIYDGAWLELIVGGESLLKRNALPAQYDTLAVHHVADRYLITISNRKKKYGTFVFSTAECVEIIEEKSNVNFFDF